MPVVDVITGAAGAVVSGSAGVVNGVSGLSLPAASVAVAVNGAFAPTEAGKVAVKLPSASVVAVPTTASPAS